MRFFQFLWIIGIACAVPRRQGISPEVGAFSSVYVLSIRQHSGHLSDEHNLSGTPWDDFEFAAELDEDGKYWLFWTPDDTTVIITFEVGISGRVTIFQAKSVVLFLQMRRLEYPEVFPDVHQQGLSSSLMDFVFSTQVHVEALGYVGFGLSPNGGMAGSDVVIGWVYDNGTAVLHVIWAFFLPCFVSFI